MQIKKFLFEYTKFTLKSKVIYYVVNTSEAFLITLILFKFIFSLNDTDALLIIGITTVLAPVGILFVGGYNKIKESFLKKHKLSEEEL
jgi:hypothetical protein